MTNDKNTDKQQYKIYDNDKTVKKEYLDSTITIAEKLNIIILPMIGYHKKMYRLGYGTGFFDKFLGKNPHIYSIGVAFKEQEIIKNIFDEHDIKISAIMTI